MSQLYFWRQCVSYAWRGTLDRANAWFWIIGVPLLAFIMWRAGYKLRIPDDPVGLIIFMIITVAIAFIILFGFRLITAPARIHAECMARLAQLEAATARLDLIGPELFVG